jgi:predicted RecB family nuclease
MAQPRPCNHHALHRLRNSGHKPGRRRPRESSPSGPFALALSQATGILPDTGKLICGDGYHHRTVKIEKHVAHTRQIIDAIGTSWQDRTPPPLVLNRHCAVCDFQQRCRELAIERDDLSLLTAMTSKERAKCNAKGIVTITQLSYGYRPRRRSKRTRPDADRSTRSAERAARLLRMIINSRH